jgi:hypothetical protein
MATRYAVTWREGDSEAVRLRHFAFRTGAMDRFQSLLEARSNGNESIRDVSIHYLGPNGEEWESFRQSLGDEVADS